MKISLTNPSDKAICFADHRLTEKAKGIYAIIECVGADVEFKELLDCCTGKYKSIRNGLSELEYYDYIQLKY